MTTQKIRVARILSIVVIVVVALAGGLAGSWATVRAGWSPFGSPDAVTLEAATTATANVGRDVSFANGFVPVVKEVIPAVVSVASSKMVRTPNSPLLSDPFFREFFGPFSRQPQQEREHSLGSGVVVSADGHILTNYHVIDGASQIKVSFSTNRQLDARVVGTDPQTDLAILKVDAENLPVVVLGDSSKTRVGDFAVAVGNSFGVGQTVTMGIISATGRGGFGIEHYEDFIQTDAAINPGNSGGALVNVNGELIGINTAIISGGGGNQGVGFAVPVNMAKTAMEQILKTGKVTRGYLGVTAQTVDTSIAKAFGVSGEPHGALVSDVTPDSPAAKSGLQKGDIILELNGQPVEDSRGLSLKVSELAPGATVQLKLWRQGHEQNVSVVLSEFPSATTSNDNEPPNSNDRGARLGISVETLTDSLAKQLRLPAQTTGVVINEVQSGSVAEDAGLRQGDVIQEVNHKAVDNAEQFQSAVRQANGQPILLLVDRGGSHEFVVIDTQ